MKEETKLQRPITRPGETVYGDNHGIDIVPSSFYNVDSDNIKNNIEIPPLSDNTEKLTPINLAYDILTRYKLANNNGQLYLFDGKIYKPLSEIEAKQFIYKDKYDIVCMTGSCEIVNSIYKELINFPYINSNYMEHGTRYSAFNNGIYDSLSGRIIENNGSIFVTNKVNASFLQEGQTPHAPFFTSYIDFISGGNPAIKDLLYKCMAYCLFSDMDAQVFFVLVGKPRSGKSLFMNILENFFDPEAVVALSIDELRSKYSSYSLINKRLCVGRDLPNGYIDAKTASILKSLTGDDLCRAEGKYKDPISFRATCKFIFSSNFRVITENNDPGFRRRLIEIPFMYSVAPNSADIYLCQKIMNERDSILQILSWYYIRLKKDNFMFPQIDPILISMAVDISSSNDIHQLVSAFIDECCLYDNFAVTANCDLYNAFLHFCGLRNININIDQKKFTSTLYNIAALESANISPTRKRLPEDKTKNLRSTAGISLK